MPCLKNEAKNTLNASPLSVLLLKRRKKKMKQSKRISPYESWTPQFEDGSGWNTTFPKHPYFYEHITEEEINKLQETPRPLIEDRQARLFKVVAIIKGGQFGEGLSDHHHKNTYFVENKYIENFLEDFYDDYYGEKVVAILPVSKVPSLKKKLPKDSE